MSAFDFGSDPETTSGFATGEGPGGANPLFAGSVWYGFSSRVSPFTLTLGPDEFIELAFDIELPATLPFEIPGQFAAGEGDSDGSPAWASAHAPTYYTSENPIAQFSMQAAGIPHVATLLTLGLMLLLALRRLGVR